MPTAFVIDLSLSMGRTICVPEYNEEWSRLRLGTRAIKIILDIFARQLKNEYVALLGYSATTDTICPFISDYDILKSKLVTLEEKSVNRFETLVAGLNRLVLTELGTTVCVEVILITDSDTGTNWDCDTLPESFAFPARFGVIAIATENECLAGVEEIVRHICDDTMFTRPKGSISLHSFDSMISNFILDVYKPYIMKLSFGELKSTVNVRPTPVKCYKATESTSYSYDPPKDICVCGFISLTDIGSPGIFSKHVIEPIYVAEKKKSSFNKKTGSDEEGMEVDDALNLKKVSNFSGLLLNSMKSENVVALCKLYDSWYGIVYPETDELKKLSYLSLSILLPGENIVPWLGDICHLGVFPANTNVTPGPDENFPVKPSEKRSYNQNLVMWVRSSSLQGDISKLLRHARKFPDKTALFYKDLNKLRRAALSFGFVEILDGLADVFDRECTLLPSSVHADCALQLTHAAERLRGPSAKDAKFTIPPMLTKYYTEVEID